MSTLPTEHTNDALHPGTQSVTLRQLQVSVLRAPLAEPIGTSFSALTNRSMVIVELTCAEGFRGNGESWVNFPSWAAAERVATLVEGVLPVLRAEPTGTPAEHYSRLLANLEPIGRQWGAPGPIAQAISAVDTALWDLLGRRNACYSSLDRPRVRDSIAVYASGLGPTRHDEQVAHAVGNGHNAVKLKVGFGREKDERDLQLVRELVGPDVAMFADANQSWRLDEATAMIPILRDAGVEWIEEPVRGDGLEDLEELHRRTGFAITTGENLYGIENFVRYLRSPAIAAIQPDLSKMGGITPALNVAAEARAADCAVFPHLFNGALAYAATTVLAAICPAVELLELDVRENPLRDQLAIEPPVVADGMVTLPTGPGHGVELAAEYVDRYLDSTAAFDL